jgi:hypothetical protein
MSSTKSPILTTLEADIKRSKEGYVSESAMLRAIQWAPHASLKRSFSQLTIGAVPTRNSQLPTLNLARELPSTST